ncbi:MAG TPA: outer membrane beta-barrel protein [Alphaproteobacteria bacterium]|nr:outer membrane beta-barrel protein [Alphaproteobacteria bacterium]
MPLTATKHNGILLGAALAAAAVLLPGLAQADSYAVQPKQGVVSVERIPKDYAPLGIRLGVFNLLPQVDLKETYTDNVFRTHSSKKSDLITTVSPLVTLQSDWARHSLGFLASADMYRYMDHTSENRTDFTLATDGRIDVQRDTQVYGGLAYRQLHEERGSPNDTATSLEPPKFNDEAVNLGAYQQFGQLNARADFRGDYYNYDTVTTRAFGAVPQVDRNRFDTQYSLRVGYDLNNGWEPFVRGRYVNSDYNTSRDRNGFQKDSDGYEVVGGAAFDLKGLWLGEAFVGYVQRDFNDSRFKSVKEPTAGATVTWNVTPATALNARVNRTITDTIVDGSSTEMDTFYGLGADTEVQPNLVLGGGVSYLNSKFNNAVRQDDTYTAGVRARYFLNRNFSVGPELQYITRDSNLSGQDYDNIIALIRLSGRI